MVYTQGLTIMIKEKWAPNELKKNASVAPESLNVFMAWLSDTTSFVLCSLARVKKTSEECIFHELIVGNS